MLAETQIQLQSAQHSVLFLQNEHAKVIAGLHEEIRNLQTKCSELTFQLAMSGDFETEIKGQTSDKELVKAPKDSKPKELIALKEENSQLKGVLEARDKRISLLEGQLKSKEQKFQNDLKLVQRNVAELKSDIDAKSNTIAYLTTQLHQMKMQSFKNDSHHSTNNTIIPAPPREGTPNSRGRPLRRTITSPVARSLSPKDSLNFSSHQLNMSELPLQSAVAIRGRNLPGRPAQSLSNPARPALGHSAAKREREMHIYSRPKPNDYEDIISASQRHIHPETNFIPRPPVDPLPPISATSSSKQHPYSSVRHSKEKNISDAKSKKRSTRGGEITEVVVDPLSSPERTWRKVQDSKYRE